MSQRTSPYAALHATQAHTCPGNGARDAEPPSDKNKPVADTPPASNNHTDLSSVVTARPPYLNAAPSATPLPNGHRTFENCQSSLPRNDHPSLTGTTLSRRDRIPVGVPSSLPSIPSVESLHSLSSSVTLPVLEPFGCSILPAEPVSHSNYIPAKELRAASSPSPPNSHITADLPLSTPPRAGTEAPILGFPRERSETNPRTAYSWHRDDPETYVPDPVDSLLGTCAPRRLRRMRNMFSADDRIPETSTEAHGREHPCTADTNDCIHVRQPELVADDNAINRSALELPTRDPTVVHQSSMIDKGVGTEHATDRDPRAAAQTALCERGDDDTLLECTAFTPRPLTARQRSYVYGHISPNFFREHGAALAAGRLYLGIKREYRYVTLFGRQFYVGGRDHVTWFSDKCRHFEQVWHPATDCKRPCFLDLDECLHVTEEAFQHLPRWRLRRYGYDRYVRRE